MRNRFQTSPKASQTHALFAVTVVVLTIQPGLGTQNCSELLRRAQELLAQDKANEALESTKKSNGSVSN